MSIVAEREGLLHARRLLGFSGSCLATSGLGFPLHKMDTMVNSTLAVKGSLGSWESTVVSMEPRIMPDPRPARVRVS